MSSQPKDIPEWLALAPDWQSFDDDRLGIELYALWIGAQAVSDGVGEVTPEIAERYRTLTESLDGESARTMAVEKAIVRVARGDAAAGGRIFRSWMLQTAEAEATNRIAAREVAKSVRAERQRNDASKKGADTVRKYTDAQRARWREMALLPKYADLSSRSAAREIRKALKAEQGIDHNADESIRKEIASVRPRKVG